MTDKSTNSTEPEVESSETAALQRENFELKVILAAMSFAFMSVVIAAAVLSFNSIATGLFPYDKNPVRHNELLTLEEFKDKQRGSNDR